MVYVTTTIGDGGIIPFEDLQNLIDCMIESQRDPGINAFKAGGKRKRSASKRRNTKKKQNKQNKLRKGRKTNKRKQNKRRSRKIR